MENNAAKDMTISVVIATYNGEKYLREQLDSILCQTLMPDEIIVSDDASVDSTWQILGEYSSRYSSLIKLYRNKRGTGSPCKNFRIGFSYAKYDIIAPSDQDDIWEPNRLERLCSGLSNDVDIVYGQDYVLSNGEIVKDPWHLETLDVVLFRNRLKGHTCIFRRSLLNLYQYADGVSWDYVLCLYGYYSGRIKELNDYLVTWRRHPDAVTYLSNCGVYNKKMVINDNIQQNKKKSSKWAIISKVNRNLNGEFSLEVQRTVGGRAQFLDYLIDCEKSVYSHAFLIHSVCTLRALSRQTKLSMFYSAVHHVLLCLRTSEFKRYVGKDRVAHLAWAYRFPYVYWNEIHKELHLG